MKIFHYGLDGVLTGEATAELDPLEQQPMIPAHATNLVPITPGAGEVAVFASGAWSVVPDYRGQKWFDVQGNAVEITNIGTPPNTLTSALPASILLANAKRDQIAELIKSCGAAIVAGFTSDALGTSHTYPSRPIDQSNLIGAVASGLAIVTFWCADSTGVWGITSHSSMQIKQVLADGATQRMAYSVKLGGLVEQVQAATTDTVEAVQAVIW